VKALQARSGLPTGWRDAAPQHPLQRDAGWTA